jgi:hypothetical protein
MNKTLWIDNNIDMINYLIEKLIIFIEKYEDDFKLITDEETFLDNFVFFLFDNYILNKDSDKIEYDNNFEYFETMYSSDIIDLFSEFKNISYGFTNDIFNHKNESYSLTEFIFTQINLTEDYNDIKESNSDDELVEEEHFWR